MPIYWIAILTEILSPYDGKRAFLPLISQVNGFFFEVSDRPKSAVIAKSAQYLTVKSCTTRARLGIVSIASGKCERETFRSLMLQLISTMFRLC